MRLFSFLLIGCASEEGVKVYNSAPTVTIVSHSSGEVFLAGYQANFQAQLQDDNHETSELSVVWSSNERTLCEAEPPNIDGTSLCTVSLEDGESLVRVQVTDPEGEAAVAAIDVIVSPSFAPTLEILSPTSEGVYYSDQLILLSAQIQDEEDAPAELSYEWESSLDGILATTAIPNDDGILEEYMYLSEGNHVLKLTVTDLSSKSTEKSLSIQIGGPNTDPSCMIVSPLMGDSFVVGESIIFQATASDAEVEVEDLELMWVSDKDGELGSGIIDSNGAVIFTYSGLSANTHTIQFSVEDELDSRCSNSIVISVGTPPELSLATPISGDTFELGSVIHFSGAVQDLEELSNQISMTWSSTIDGEFSTQGSNSTGELDVYVSDLSAGQHSISITATDSMGLTDSESLSIFINAPPTAPTLSLSPIIAYTDDNIMVLASGSTDSEGDSISYVYEWFQNSSLTSYVASVLPSSATTKEDIWMVRVTPNDGYHDGSSSESIVQILNSAPEISSVILDTTLATSSQVVSCFGSASDDDGDTLTETYLWENQTSGVVLSSLSTLTLSPVHVSVGDSIVCTYSVDDGSDSDSLSTALSIENTAPTIDALSVVPSTPYVGDTLTCLGTVSDSDLENTTNEYLWENQTTGVVLSIDMALELDTSIASPNDVISCTLSVSDASGGSATDTVTVSIGNLPPSIDALSFDTSALAVGDTVTCLSSESDPEGDILSLAYEWRNESNGVVIGSGASLTLTSSMGTGLDEISCTATAVDSYGASDTESISIFIEETVPVFITEASISPTTGLTTSTTLSCTGVATDPDGTSVVLSYDWIVGTTTIGTSQSISLSPTMVQPTDVVECVITATDVSGEQATSNTSVMIGNSPPTLTSLTITPSTGINSSSVLVCSVTVTDADLEIPTPTYTWTNGSVLLGGGTSLTLDPSLAQPSDSITCEVSVTDGFGASISDSIFVTVENTAPSISSVHITPTIAYNDSTLTCSAISFDADNQSLTTTYLWSNSTTGDIIGTSSIVTLDSSIASRTDIIVCQATATDPSSGSANSSTSQTLVNRAPTAPVVQISPGTVYADSTLTCSASGGDIDGDPVSYSYEWNINGGSTIATTNTLSSVFAAGETIECIATPNDGLLDGSSTIQSIVISNTPPVISSVTLTPEPVYTNDTLTGSASYSDLDGDIMSVMYTWSVNGSEVQTGSNHTLSGSFFDKGEVVLLSVVADDGNDMSVASTGTLTVSNSLPSAPGISLFPSAPIEGVDDLLCSIDTSSGDADSDSVSYSFAWTVDTVVFTSSTDTATTSTISAFDTISGEDWACTVTPNDGDADGSSSNVSVFIEGGCDSFSEVDYNGSCYYLDGSGGSCDSGYVLAPQSVLATISSSFIGKTYKNQVSGNCCIWHANQSSERQDYGMSAECNSSGPFTVGPVLGGAGCNDALNLGSTQLTLCVSN